MGTRLPRLGLPAPHRRHRLRKTRVNGSVAQSRQPDKGPGGKKRGSDRPESMPGGVQKVAPPALGFLLNCPKFQSYQAVTVLPAPVRARLQGWQGHKGPPHQGPQEETQPPLSISM